jgi:hypothetical protein
MFSVEKMVDVFDRSDKYYSTIARQLFSDLTNIEV